MFQISTQQPHLVMVLLFQIPKWKIQVSKMRSKLFIGSWKFELENFCNICISFKIILNKILIAFKCVFYKLNGNCWTLWRFYFWYFWYKISILIRCNILSGWTKYTRTRAKRRYFKARDPASTESSAASCPHFPVIRS